MKIKGSYVVSLMLSLVFITSCKKEFDVPAKSAAPAVSGYITIDSIYKKFISYYKTPPTPSKLFRFPDDVNLICTVTADETSGNIYKGVYVEDATGGLKINLLNFGGLYVGDKISINLNGVILNDYGRVVQLDSLDIVKHVVKLSSGNTVTPTKVTFNQFIFLNAAGHSPLQSRLVMIDSVEFASGDKGQPYADAIGKYSLDRNLLNSTGKQVIVRSSGYANFASNIIPCGKGSMVAVVGQFNSDIQLTIRDLREVKLASGGCPLLIKHFNDQSIASGGWSTFNVTGSINWEPGSYSGQVYGQISNYVAGNNVPCESWLISPAINTSSSANPRFSFQSAYNYSGPAIQVYVSTDYVSGNPSAATWTLLSPVLSSGSWNWVNSGSLSLTPYKSTNTRIAFKYTGSASDGSTWEIDDIAVYGE